jgi:hypothetical protein
MPFTNAYDVPYTAGITILTVLLGFPTALATIYLTHAFVPSITLGTKQIDAGPSGPKTLTLGLLTSSDDAVLASAYISVLSSLAVASGIVLLRHLRLKKGDALIGWGVMGPAVGNFFGQVGCLVAWILMQGKSDAKVGREEDVTLVDGMYGSAGRMFTREAWACTMNSVFREKEGNWAEKACSHLVCRVFILLPLYPANVCIETFEGNYGWHDDLCVAYSGYFVLADS